MSAPRRIVTGHDADGKSVILDDGSETLMKPQDVVVQRGTHHAWANRGEAPVRMMFVMIDATISESLRAATGPLQFFDQALE